MFFLSNIDHIVRWVRTIYAFRSKDRGHEDAGEVIKNALRQLLVHYYPFAGRLVTVSKGKLAVSGYEEGAVFVEAEADCVLEEIEDVAKVDPTKLREFVYDDGIHGGVKPLEHCPLLIGQVTKLKCGGFVLGLCVSHCLADGVTVTELVNSWSELARGMPSISILPSFDKTTVQPRDPPKVDFPHPEFMEIEAKTSISHEHSSRKESMVYKIFPLSNKKIENLKATTMEDVTSCTTFECLTSFVWRARTRALDFAPDQEAKLMVAVDVREKLDPPLPRGYVGNGIGVACVTCTARKLLSDPFAEVVMLVHDSITMVADDYVRSAIDYYEVHRTRQSLGYTMIATKWSRISFLATDFGWGNAVLMAPVAIRDEMVIFLPNNGGKEVGDNNNSGISVFVGLPESAMKIFEGLIVTLMN
ncbi:unnamed protein product [Linum tenue]|uniref:Uncharacterized protein n=2 Tax=Linum tenue TaxID=586396 RepID=A0AAV0PUQ7_9ROSI|nr:unnamed protein product [Linum tenue]